MSDAVYQKKTVHCKDCDKDLGHYQKKIQRCKPCSGLFRRAKTTLVRAANAPRCIDCGITVSVKTVKRCQPCYHKSKLGENHWNWLTQKPVCLDCGKGLASRGKLRAIRCWDCHKKSGHIQGDKNHKWLVVRPKCIDCGKEVCSRKKPQRCRQCFLRNGTLKGDQNHNWKGGVLLINDREIYSQQITKWRRAVFKRDSHSCQLCGRKGSSLQAHHKQPWATHKELRFEVSNGVTLCRDCHLNIAHQGKWQNEPLNFWI